ncbi:branched-chain amino acid ABC transporter permease [Euzebya tangerina]|uniref:branched-chain amino acid ABC transporter permease n=1 Tax=Euzebya tangerina TaxID=591198 RepID=UPI000E31C4DF|nr:branched-chain amino acid ABC transporter permease [Euzebya tangerina]
MLQQLIGGLEAGSSYAVIALAIVVIMKSTDVPNFAMAEMGLVVAYVAWGLTEIGLSFLPAVALSLVFAAIFGAAIEFAALRPLSGASHFPTLLMTIGLTFALGAGIHLLAGSAPQSFPSPWRSVTYDVGGQVISLSALVTIATGFVVALLLGLFFKTSWGVQMRAIAEDRSVARLLGISAGRVSALAWALGTVMAGVALILATSSTVLSPGIATALILKGFVAAVLGGFTSMTGAFLGGLLIGVLENLSGAYISTSSKSAIALLVVFVVLLWKPEGMFAAARAREV